MSPGHGTGAQVKIQEADLGRRAEEDGKSCHQGSFGAGVTVEASPPDLKGVSWLTSAQLNSLGSKAPCILRMGIG